MNIPEFTKRLIEETERIIVGKRRQIELIIMTMLADGHVLLDDLPGVGKTTLVKTMSIASGCSFKRIQFVPDLLPSDITGMNIYDRKSGEFRMLKGPVFTNILLADEINRAVPRTQSALLEAMEERQVTIDGETMSLPRPFIVMATQNPVESESTFRLPAAQMDRFLVRLSMGYPDSGDEVRMLRSLGDAIPFSSVGTVTSPEEINELKKKVAETVMSDQVAEYIVSIVAATRSDASVKMGCSPRASRALFRAAKAWAAMAGRQFVTPDDVQELAVPVLAHRLALTNSASMTSKTEQSVITEILGRIPVPPKAGEVFV